MTGIALLVASIVLFFTFHIRKGDWSAPSVVFGGVWTSSLFVLFLVGDLFFSIQNVETYVIFIGGMLLFLFGDLSGDRLAKAWPAKRVAQVNWQVGPSTEIRVRHLFIKAVIVGLIIGLPFFYRGMQEAANSFDSASFLADVRRANLSRERTGEFRWLDNLLIVSMIVGPIAWLEHQRTRLAPMWPALVIFLAIAYASLSGTKTGAIYALVPILFVHAMVTGRIPWRSVVVIAPLLLTTFAAGLLLVNFALIWSEETAGNLATLLGRTLLGYWVGSLICFDAIVAHPSAIESTQPYWRTLAELLNSFGARFEIPNLHAVYTEIAPDFEYNTYSIYFTYYKDLGWLGMGVFMPTLGMVCGVAHRLGRTLGSSSATVLYGMLMTGIVLSTHSERFWLNANFLLKLALLLILIYSVTPWVVGRVSLAVKRTSPAA